MNRSRRSIERNRPKAIGRAAASNKDSVLFKDLDIVLSEDSNAIVVTKLRKRHEGAGLEIVKNKSRLCPRAKTRRKGKEAVEGGWHDSATSRENGRASRSRSQVAKMDYVGAGDKSTGGARIKDNMRGTSWWAIYRRERDIRVKRRQRMLDKVPYGRPGLSSGEPKTVGGVAAVHVGKGSTGLVTRELIVAFRTRMRTGTMRPAVGTSRRGSVATTTARAIRGTTLTSITSVARMSLMSSGGGETSTHERHHFCHLRQKSSFASGKSRVALLEDNIGDVGCGWRNKRKVIGGQSIKEALRNKISHSGDRVGLMRGLLVKDVTSIGKGTKVALGVPKMVQHVGPCAFDNRTAVPETKILLENWLASKNDIGHVDHLLVRHRRQGMFGEISKVVNSVEHGVDRL